MEIEVDVAPAGLEDLRALVGRRETMSPRDAIGEASDSVGEALFLLQSSLSLHCSPHGHGAARWNIGAVCHL